MSKEQKLEIKKMILKSWTDILQSRNFISESTQRKMIEDFNKIK